MFLLKGLLSSHRAVPGCLFARSAFQARVCVCECTCGLLLTMLAQCWPVIIHVAGCSLVSAESDSLEGCSCPSLSPEVFCFPQDAASWCPLCCRCVCWLRQSDLGLAFCLTSSGPVQPMEQDAPLAACMLATVEW